MSHPITADYATLPLPLTMAEHMELERHEATIAEGLQTFYDVGEALALIKNKKLYRGACRTFEEYCGTRWNISKPRAYQLIDAAAVVENLSTNVDVLPTSEAQARALKAAPPDRQADVWKHAQATAPGGNVTAKHIQQVIQQEFPREPAPELSPAPARQVSVFTAPERIKCDGCGKWFDAERIIKHHGQSLHRECYQMVLYNTTQEKAPEPPALPPNKNLFCNFCGHLDTELKMYQASENNTVQAVICEHCAATAARQLMPGLLEGFAWYNVDRAKLVKAGLRVLRLDEYAMVIKEYNGTGWELFEKHPSKAALKRSAETWAQAPNIIFENHL